MSNRSVRRFWSRSATVSPDPLTDRALGAVAQPGGPGSFGRFHIRRSGGRPSGSCRTVNMTQPGPDPDNYPPIDPAEPVPDDPGPLSPDTPETPVSYTHLRAHETRHDLVCRL